MINVLKKIKKMYPLFIEFIVFIIIILILFSIIVHYYNTNINKLKNEISILKEELEKQKIKEENYEKLNIYLDQMQQFDPKLSEFLKKTAKEIDDDSFNENFYKKLEDNSYYSEMKKLHGIQNYNLRFKFFKLPIRKIENPSEVDLNCIITSEYGGRWISLSKSGNWHVNEYLKKNKIKVGYEGYLNIPGWGRCFSKVYKYSIAFLQYHSALDIASKNNYGVYAAAKGTVVEVSYDKVFGNYITIRHFIDNNYYETVYCHLSETKVKVGDEVEDITWIGIIGSSGITLGEHLHWCIKEYNSKKRRYYTINPVINSTYGSRVYNDKYLRDM